MKQWLKNLTWMQTFGCILFIIIASKLVFKHSALLPLRWIIGGIFFILKYYVDWPKTVERLRAVREKSLIQKLVQLMPPIFPALFRLHYVVGFSFWKWIKREPINGPTIIGTPITFHQKSQYSTYLILFFLSCIVDLPISTFMAGLFFDDPTLISRLHTIVLIMTLYAIIFVLEDRWAIKASYHVLGQNTLYLRLGDRFSADLPLDNILCVTKIDEPVRIWCMKNRQKSLGKIIVSPIDSPIILITLQTSSSIEAQSFKAYRTLPEYVFLYVDNPHLLLSIMHKR